MEEDVDVQQILDKNITILPWSELIVFDEHGLQNDALGVVLIKLFGGDFQTINTAESGDDHDYFVQHLLNEQTEISEIVEACKELGFRERIIDELESGLARGEDVFGPDIRAKYPLFYDSLVSDAKLRYLKKSWLHLADYLGMESLMNRLLHTDAHIKTPTEALRHFLYVNNVTVGQLREKVHGFDGIPLRAKNIFEDVLRKTVERIKRRDEHRRIKRADEVKDACDIKVDYAKQLLQPEIGEKVNPLVKDAGIWENCNQKRNILLSVLAAIAVVFVAVLRSNNDATVHGNWGKFGPWSACSKDCGGGERKRSRLCNDPAPLYNGNSCDIDGSKAEQSEDCNTDPCPMGSVFFRHLFYMFTASSVISLRPFPPAYNKCPLTTTTTTSGKLNVSHLAGLLQSRVFGQRRAREVVIDALQQRLSLHEADKALVLSFHGQTGTGKTHVANILSDFLYGQGTEREFVHWRDSTVNYVADVNNKEAVEDIREFVTTHTRMCSCSMFVFDEFDKMSAVLAAALRPYLEPHQDVEGINHRNNIFIFLNNFGANLTSNIDNSNNNSNNNNNNKSTTQQPSYKESMLSHISSSNTSLRPVSDLIDYFVPFLPLHLAHVERCIETSRLHEGSDREIGGEGCR